MKLWRTIISRGFALSLLLAACFPPRMLQSVLYDFDDGIQGWRAAHLEDSWPDNETAISVAESREAGHDTGALWGSFDFGKTTANFPRATYYHSFPATPKDWTSAVELRFDARFLPTTDGTIKATFVVKTGDQFCYNEHSDFQFVEQEWTSLAFPLKSNRYNSCDDPDGYDASLIGGNQVVEFALVFIPSPDNDRFAGAVLIDNVRLIERP